jgi:ATP-binding cassette subfamily F protein uup
VLLGLDGEGSATFYGDFAQWRRSLAGKSAPARKRATPRQFKPRGPKMSYLEKKELAGIETAITEAEAELEESIRREQDPSVASDAAELQARFDAREAAQARVDSLYARWQELEAKREAEGKGEG